MINGTGTLSLRKQDLENQKTPATGFVKTQFAHKATAGQTGISLNSLTVPTEMSTNGFTNPSASQLAAANLLFYQRNLTLISSARGQLIPFQSYTISASSQINFNGFTALEGEIFVGTIDYTAISGVKVVDARAINAPGTLTAGTVDFNVGEVFRVGQYATKQIGSVLVFLDGVLQFRNTGNSLSTLDGNYAEVDNGGALGTIIRFNSADPVNDRGVVVLSNGLLSERADGSMIALIENIQGQVNNIATYVAPTVGQSVTTVLGNAPTNQDLKAFGDLVSTKASTTTGNTWTAVQNLLGRTDGVAVSTGKIGELVTAALAGINQTSPVAGTFYDDNGQLALTSGFWLVVCRATVVGKNPGSISGNAVPLMRLSLRDLSNNVVSGAYCAAGQVNGVQFVTSACIVHPIFITTSTTYKQSISYINSTGAPTLGSFNTNDLTDYELFAIRLA